MEMKHLADWDWVWYNEKYEWYGTGMELPRFIGSKWKEQRRKALQSKKKVIIQEWNEPKGLEARQSQTQSTNGERQQNAYFYDKVFS